MPTLNNPQPHHAHRVTPLKDCPRHRVRYATPLSQTEFAALLGISAEHLSRIENGRPLPPTLGKLMLVTALAILNHPNLKTTLLDVA